LIRIVLQGEYAVVKGDGELKTSSPKTCTVFTLYEPTSRLAVLAHVDDYVSAVDTIDKIKKTLKFRFNAQIEKVGFTAKVMGGDESFFSLQQQRKILSIFKILNITFEKVALPLDKTQISLNAQTGALHLLNQGQRDERLEYLQKREYGEWNNWLDIHYDGVPGDQIPFFQAKEASRFETDIPQFEWVNVDAARALETRGKLKLPIKTGRDVAKDGSAELMKLVTNKRADSYIKLINEKNYNLLLRRAAVDPKDIEILKFLVDHSILLEIDLNARGETSGTAFDVATKYKNQPAIELLS